MEEGAVGLLDLFGILHGALCLFSQGCQGTAKQDISNDPQIAVKGTLRTGKRSTASSSLSLEQFPLQALSPS